MGLRSALESSDSAAEGGWKRGMKGGSGCREGDRGEIKPRAQPANAAARADAEISLRPLVVIHVVHLVVRVLVAVPRFARRTTAAEERSRGRGSERRERIERGFARGQIRTRACVRAGVRARGGACVFSRVGIPGVEEKKRPRRPLMHRYASCDTLRRRWSRFLDVYISI